MGVEDLQDLRPIYFIMRLYYGKNIGNHIEGDSKENHNLVSKCLCY